MYIYISPLRSPLASNVPSCAAFSKVCAASWRKASKPWHLSGMKKPPFWMGMSRRFYGDLMVIYDDLMGCNRIKHPYMELYSDLMVISWLLINCSLCFEWGIVYTSFNQLFKWLAIADWQLKELTYSQTTYGIQKDVQRCITPFRMCPPSTSLSGRMWHLIASLPAQNCLQTSILCSSQQGLGCLLADPQPSHSLERMASIA